MKTKPAQSKVLLEAERERQEIAATMKQLLTRMRALSRRLRAAARHAEPVGVVGKALSGETVYTVEAWFASTFEEIDHTFSEDLRLVQEQSLTKVRRDVAREVREETEREQLWRQQRVEALNRGADLIEELGSGALQALKRALEIMKESGAKGTTRAVRARALLDAIETIPPELRPILEKLGPKINLDELAAAAARGHAAAPA